MVPPKFAQMYTLNIVRAQKADTTSLLTVGTPLKPTSYKVSVYCSEATFITAILGNFHRHSLSLFQTCNYSSSSKLLYKLLHLIYHINIIICCQYKNKHKKIKRELNTEVHCMDAQKDTEDAEGCFCLSVNHTSLLAARFINDQRGSYTYI